jgi:hypothetical protein
LRKRHRGPHESGEARDGCSEEENSQKQCKNVE